MAQKRINKKSNNYSDKQKVAYYKSVINGMKANYRKPYKYPGAGAKMGASIGALSGRFVGSKLPIPMGGSIGSAAGTAIGTAVGHGAHSLLKTVTGLGDYTVHENYFLTNRDAVPQFSNDGRNTVVTHREFVGDIQSSTTFRNQSYNINPANQALFPWLSGIASNYEECIWQGLIFEFKTTSATAVSSTNTALGTIVMATQYNSLAPAFTNKQQMENYEYAQSVVPCNSVMHAIECDPKVTANQGLFYVDNDGYSATADPRLYNIGRFNIAAVGSQATATVGELWVTYKVVFLKPKLQIDNLFADHWLLDSGSITSANPFGLVFPPSLSTSSSSYNVSGTAQALTALINSPWSGVTNNQYIFINPNYVGRLLLVYQLHSGAAIAGAVDPILTAFGTCSIVSTTTNNFGFVSYVKQYVAAGGQDVQLAYIIQCNGGLSGVIYPYIAFSGGTITSTAGNANLLICSVSSNLSN